MHRRSTRIGVEFVVAAGVAAMALVAGPGCARGREDRSTLEGPSTQSEAQAFVKRAIRSSPEGVILMPSRKAEQVFELPRLNEIAQQLRAPAAACFVQRAIETMKRSDESDRGYAGVPEGQVKVRTRISPAGKVVRTEVLESGFEDPAVPECLTRAIEEKRWPPNESGNNHYVDVVYWVSLGFFSDASKAAFRRHLRREQAQAGVRAKNCLQGRVDAGTYRVEGLNLMDRDGATLTNRLDPVSLPDPVRQCVARAFRDIRIPRESEAFVRPVSPSVEFTVTRDGTVTVSDEDWLRLTQLEDRAKRAQKRAELTGDEPDVDVVEPPSDGSTQPVDELGSAPTEAPASEPAEPAPAEPAPPPESAREPNDPAKGGLRLDLGGRGGGG